MTHSLLQYRIDRMAAARVIAHTTVGPPTIGRNISWEGLRYPIMAALTGLDNDGVTSGNSGSAEHGYVTFPRCAYGLFPYNPYRTLETMHD